MLFFWFSVYKGFKLLLLKKISKKVLLVPWTSKFLACLQYITLYLKVKNRNWFLFIVSRGGTLIIFSSVQDFLLACERAQLVSVSTAYELYCILIKFLRRMEQLNLTTHYLHALEYNSHVTHFVALFVVFVQTCYNILVIFTLVVDLLSVCKL